MIRAMMVEDNPHIREKNKRLIQENCLDVQIVGEADRVETVIEVISVFYNNIRR